jgi:type IV secretion system protein VirB11
VTIPAQRDPNYLRSYLAPLADVLAQSDVTDIYINRPGEIWIETLGGSVERHDAPALDEAVLSRLARQIAALSHQGISREHPLLSATLPDGSRVQIAGPPATRGPMAIAIRKHISSDLALSDYQESGAFSNFSSKPGEHASSVDEELLDLLKAGEIGNLLKCAVHARKNILVSGGTSTGKTDSDERLILIEDTPELILRHPNAIGLLASRSALGEAFVSAEDLLNTALRMRPDRIMVGELRGPEAFTFLRAVNTGHPGSMTTVHADSPERALEQIALLVLQSGTQLSRDDILQYARSVIDVFVQLSRSGGRRHVSDIALSQKDGRVYRR